jgi:predicted DNA-binding transcriptional regulator YafY
MNPLICKAIHEKRRLRFVYHGKPRLVEPQCHGISTAGREVLRAHQIRGGTQPEPLFELAKMSELVLLDEHFTRPGPHYKPNDSAMALIFCQL